MINSQAKPQIALVGAGSWGKNHVRNFYDIGALYYICDSNENLLTQFEKSYPNIRITTDFAKVLTNKKIAGVVIATPAETHYTLAKEAILAGKDVLVEKPLSMAFVEGQELVQLAKQNGRVLMVGHLLWYHPAVIALKSLFAKGELGRIRYICSNRLNLGKIRREENILWSFAPHDISVILGLVGEMPENIIASGGYFLHKKLADTTMTILEFPSGVNANIFVSWLHPFKEHKLVVVGDKKMAVFNDMEPDKKLTLYPHKVEWRNNIPIPERAEGYFVELENSEPLKNECNHFLECISSRATPRTSGEEGLRVLSVLQECQKSLDRGYNGNFFRTAIARQNIAALDYFIHNTSIVDDNVTIGTDTKIWHFSHILKDSQIGKRCNIGQNVVIGPSVKIGNGCKIQNNVSIYQGVTLEDDVFCGPSMVFTNVYNPRASIRRMDEVRPTIVKKGTTIGANATILCGLNIGEYSFIGAGAVVIRDVPPYALMVGNPATQKGWICECGVKLNFNSGKTIECTSCKKTYKQVGKKKIEKVAC